MRATSCSVESWVGVVQEDLTAEMRGAVERRILIAQALYAFGALLCVFSTYVSIAFIVLVRLIYTIGPRATSSYRP